MYDITAIKNYILFLKTQCGLSVTLHPFGKESLILSSELITFNIHENPYCIYVKSFPEAQKHCIERQQRIVDRCQPEEAFCGRCFAGVEEFVYPIFDGHGVVGFISVSGYRCEEADSYIIATAKKYGIPLENLSKIYQALCAKKPDRRDVDALIIPLCQMLELAYLKTENNGKPENTPMGRIIRYIKQHHTRNITLEEVCECFSYSRSYVSHMFKKTTGLGFREYLAQIRVEDAKALLRYSKLGVTEIALSVGFTDSNYFSRVFKSHTGMSPVAYRMERK